MCKMLLYINTVKLGYSWGRGLRDLVKKNSDKMYFEVGFEKKES